MELVKERVRGMELMKEREMELVKEREREMELVKERGMEVVKEREMELVKERGRRMEVVKERGMELVKEREMVTEREVRGGETDKLHVHVCIYKCIHKNILEQWYEEERWFSALPTCTLFKLCPGLMDIWLMDLTKAA